MPFATFFPNNQKNNSHHDMHLPPSSFYICLPALLPVIRSEGSEAQFDIGMRCFLLCLAWAASVRWKVVQQRKVIFQDQQERMADAHIGQWHNIPSSAFLYFPQGQQLISNSQPKKPEKQWRKIFEGGQAFNQFENNALSDLEQAIRKKKFTPDEFFDIPNKLRFLQANKFDIDKTVQSMIETTKWRSKSFPIHLDDKTAQLLNSGAFYFSGRDHKYRPILAVDIAKFNEDAENDDSIQKSLVVIMEFMINELLIEGQVENYILIMDLQKASFGLRGVIMKILSFTSNSYRGRLYASYLLSMPGVLRWGWEAIVSKFVSENTLNKIKITGDPYNNDMWNHISRDTIEQKYGGDMANMKGSFWPPRQQLLLFVDPVAEARNNLIGEDQYDQLWKGNRLTQRKVLQKFIKEEASEPEPVEQLPSPELRYLRTLQVRRETAFQVDQKIVKTFFQSTSYSRISTFT